MRDTLRLLWWSTFSGRLPPAAVHLDDTMFTGPLDASTVKVAVLTTPDKAAVRVARTALTAVGIRFAVTQTPRVSRVFTDVEGRRWADVKPWVVLVGAPDASRAHEVVRGARAHRGLG